MVDNSHTHLASVPSGPRRLVPGWDYWALALLGAPLAASAVALLIFAALDVNDHVWIGVVACALAGALVGWSAPSARRLTPALRAVWVAVSGLLSLAIPVVVLLALLYVSCHDGGCFS
jgi:hypothetical protein